MTDICIRCTTPYVGCQYTCMKKALSNKQDKTHKLAVFFEKENEKMRKKWRVKEMTVKLVGTYMVWVNKEEVVFTKATDVVEAMHKVERQGYKTTGKVDRIDWGDKYERISDIPDTVLAEHGIQPRCRKCNCLIDINNVHTKHGRAYCPKCMQSTK